MIGTQAIYSLGKVFLEPEEAKDLKALEDLSKKAHLPYLVLYKNIREKWEEWRERSEAVLLESVKHGSIEFRRFAKLTREINKQFAKKEIDISMIKADLANQVAILETLSNDPDLLLRKKVSKPKRPKQTPRTRLESIIDKIMSNPWYKMIAILSTMLGLISLLLKILGFF